MKVLLVDDHPLILSALRSVIQGLGDDVTVVGAASARLAREALAEASDYDLVLLDLHLGDADGFDVLVELRAAYPALPVVVVSASDRSSDVIRSIDLGAMGFVPKRSSNEMLFVALRMVMSGGIFVPPMDLASADAGQRGGRSGEDGSGGGHGSRPAHLDAVRQAAEHGDYRVQQATLESIGLTPRQTEVLGLLLKGQPNKLIARELGVSVETVKYHVAAVLRALNVNSRTQAVLAVGQMTHEARGAAWRAPRPPQ